MGRLLCGVVSGVVSLGLLAGLSAPAEASAAFREGGTLGWGLTTGATSFGVSTKFFASETMALQAAFTLGLIVAHDTAFLSPGVGGDYLIQRPLIQDEARYDVGWYVGGGARVNWLGTALDRQEIRTYALTPMAVVGLEFGLVRVPIDLVIEYRPQVTYSPDGGVSVYPTSTNMQLRYYFL